MVVEGRDEYRTESILDDRVRYRRREWLVKFVGDPRPRWLTYDRINTGGVNSHWREYEDRVAARAVQAQERRARRRSPLVPEPSTELLAVSDDGSVGVDDEDSFAVVCLAPTTDGYRWERRPPRQRWLVVTSGASTTARALAQLHSSVSLVTVDLDYSDPVTLDMRRAFQPGYFDVVWLTPPSSEYSRMRPPYDVTTRSHVRALLRVLTDLRPAIWVYEHPTGSGYALTSELHEFVPTASMHDAIVSASVPVHIWTSDASLALAAKSYASVGASQRDYRAGLPESVILDIASALLRS